jgi:hypothetical protein
MDGPFHFFEESEYDHMTLEPIKDENGSIVDYFETSQQPASSTATAQTAALPDQEQPVEEDDQPEPVEGAVLPEGVTAALPTDLVEQPATLTATASLPREDTTDFDLSDIEIRILLQRTDGDPRGRSVSVVIHNFSGSPIVRDFREADLTDTARLDAIQRAIYPTMQAFLLALAERKQKKLEEEAKRATRTVPPVQNGTVAQPKTPPVSTVPTTTKSVQNGQQQQEATSNVQATNDNTKSEKDTAKKAGKYQPIPLF